MSKQTQAVRDVLAQHARNPEKWGNQAGHSPHEWLGLIAEEQGEAAKEANRLAFEG